MIYYHWENITVLQGKYHFHPKRAAKHLGLRAVKCLSVCFPRESPCNWDRCWWSLWVIALHCNGFCCYLERSVGKLLPPQACSLPSPLFPLFTIASKRSPCSHPVAHPVTSLPLSTQTQAVPGVIAAPSAVLAPSQKSLTANQFECCRFKIVFFEICFSWYCSLPSRVPSLKINQAD